MKFHVNVAASFAVAVSSSLVTSCAPPLEPQSAPTPEQATVPSIEYDTNPPAQAIVGTWGVEASGPTFSASTTMVFEDGGKGYIRGVYTGDALASYAPNIGNTRAFSWSYQGNGTWQALSEFEGQTLFGVYRISPSKGGEERTMYLINSSSPPTGFMKLPG